MLSAASGKALKRIGHVKGIEEPVRAVFIRAPFIKEVGSKVEVFSVYNG